MYICVNVCHMYAGAQGGQKKVLDPLMLNYRLYEMPDVGARN